MRTALPSTGISFSPSAASSSSSSSSSTLHATSQFTHSIMNQSSPSTAPPNNAATSPAATPCETFLRSILGTWKGLGTTTFPTMASAVQFTHEASFALPSGPTKSKFVKSTTSTHNAKMTTMGMHFDDGYLKCVADREATWMLAHNSGNTEALTGAVAADGKSAIFTSSHIGGAPTTVATKRELTLVQESGGSSNKAVVMLQRFFMATQTVPLTLHLDSKLEKQL